MSNDGLKIILIAIISLIVILILVLVAIYYKDKLAKKREEEQAPKNDEEIKQDKKSVFRFMEFDEVEDNMIVQDNGARYLMVVECKGINYDLLSGVENASVEEGFIQFLNTLRHPIQIYVQTRAVNLAESIQRYKTSVEQVEMEYNKKQIEYNQMRQSGNYSEQ